MLSFERVRIETGGSFANIPDPPYQQQLRGFLQALNTLFSVSRTLSMTSRTAVKVRSCGKGRRFHVLTEDKRKMERATVCEHTQTQSFSYRSR